MYASDEDQYTRLYVCMKASGVTVPGDPAISAIGDFRAAAKNYYDCGAASDNGWPRDYGFLRCIQKKFHADFHQSNVFLKCLDLSEGSMMETIQTPASFLFLGSYNFVTMLLASMSVITSFLMFTAGGYYTSKEFQDFHGHVGGSVFWSPLAWGPTALALLWSVFMLFSVMIYTFPPSNMWSDAINGAAGALPGTPWTGFMCSAVTIGMVVYFASCLAELYSDSKVKQSMDGGSIMNSSDSIMENGAAELPVKDGGMMNYSQNMQNIVVDTPGMQPGQPVRPQAFADVGFYSQSGRMNGQSSNPGIQVNTPPAAGLEPASDSLTGVASMFPYRNRHGYSRLPTKLGVRYNSQLHFTGSSATKIAPSLNRAFALTWVFADGLLFIGMLNSQNSLLHENVVAIWYYITLCRVFQLAATYFMDDVLFIEFESNAGSAAAVVVDSEKEDKEANFRNNQIKCHAGIAVACAHLSSLWCMIIVIYHFSSAISVTTELNTHGIGSPIQALQITFVAFIAALDVFKHIIAFLAIFNSFTQEIYMLIVELTFTADWLIRFLFITSTIFTVPQYLGDNNSNLFKYIFAAPL
jgi:hypothetical protein